MIEKMKFLGVTDPKGDIGRIIDQYLSKYDIQLENALSELKTVKDLGPYMESNPYKDVYQRSGEILSSLDQNAPPTTPRQLPTEEAVAIVQELDSQIKELLAREEELTAEMETLQTSLDKVNHFTGLSYDLSAILQFRYIKFRSSRIARDYYDKLFNYVHDTIDTVLCNCKEDEDHIWVVYFVPDTISDKVDAIYSSIHFEHSFLPGEYEGTPAEAMKSPEDKIAEVNASTSQIDNQINSIPSTRKDDLIATNQRPTALSNDFDMRKLTACTKQNVNTFCTLCGWMTEEDTRAFQQKISGDDKTYCMVEGDHSNIINRPPTKLKNPKLFEPFEMFIGMYRLPPYNEIDPAILIGITYSILLGFMFGGVGQRLCLLTGGFLLFKTKKMSLAAITSCRGFFSTMLGFLFDSVFGSESIIRAVWLRLKGAMTQLPFIGNLNTVFIVAIALGMGIVIMTMVLSIINNVRSYDTEKAYFGTNGVAGFVLYGGIIVTVVPYMAENPPPAAIVLVVVFTVPLLIVFLKELLTAMIEKKAEIIPRERDMFLVQSSFEIFEVLLNYPSNTLSFVRVGAFAVSHAAIMEVVLMLVGAEAGGSPNWLVVILGDVFICGMEGLIVGIQILRLKYYKLFSRFYREAGRAFELYDKKA